MIESDMNETNNGEDPTKQKLKFLFYHYAQIGDKLNQTFMKSNQF